MSVTLPDLAGDMSDPEAKNLMDLHNLSAQREAILGFATSISDPMQTPMFRAILRAGLDEHLQDFKASLLAVDRLRISFSHGMTRHTAAYDGVIDRFGVDGSGETSEMLGVDIPKDALQSVITLSAGGTENTVEPQVWLKVRTDNEPTVYRISEDEIVEDNSQGRWIGFPIAVTQFEGLDIMG